jgi:hypothetical protein
MNLFVLRTLAKGNGAPGVVAEQLPAMLRGVVAPSDSHNSFATRILTACGFCNGDQLAEGASVRERIRNSSSPTHQPDPAGEGIMASLCSVSLQLRGRRGS